MSEINISNSIVQEINLLFFNKGANNLFIKRDDLIHPFVSGNKWRKLKYNVEEIELNQCAGCITFGGAYSNHLLAVASAAQQFNIKSIAYVRGEELNENSNLLLRKCSQLGMELRFISRSSYFEKKQSSTFLYENELKYLVIPEGGANGNGIKGCEEILKETTNDFDVICLSQGTCTTSLGILFSSPITSEIWVFPALKGFDSFNEMKSLSERCGRSEDFQLHQHRIRILDQFHFGGYAQKDETLMEFIFNFQIQSGIQLDAVYTGKAMYGLLHHLNELQNKRILFIHTGGVNEFNN
jgi:1-aminocyclopropane-1-carboxylate deaminase